VRGKLICCGLQTRLGERARIYPCREVRERLFSFGLQALLGGAAAKAGEGDYYALLRHD